MKNSLIYLLISRGDVLKFNRAVIILGLNSELTVNAVTQHTLGLIILQKKIRLKSGKRWACKKPGIYLLMCAITLPSLASASGD